MQRYLFQEQLGDGTFGTVFRAVNRTTGEQVAVKCMKRSFSDWQECLALREFRSLLAVGHDHPNIVQLHEIVREANAQLYFVFEYMPNGNLYELIKSHTPNPALMLAGLSVPILTEARIQSIITQVLQALSFLHKKGYVHRDIKPENILLKGNVCKLADFGLAREVTCQKTKTDYVSTRWYRAPEVLLRSPDYSKPIDLFGLGCIVAELYSKEPLFPGDTEIDQIFRITQVLGSPKKTWKESTKLAAKIGFEFHAKQVYTLKKRVPSASPAAILFLEDLLQWNPKDRPTCDEALKHDYFSTPSLEALVAVPPLLALRCKRPLMVPTQLYDAPAAKRRRGLDYVSIHDVWPPQSFCFGP